MFSPALSATAASSRALTAAAACCSSRIRSCSAAAAAAAAASCRAASDAAAAACCSNRILSCSAAAAAAAAAARSLSIRTCSHAAAAVAAASAAAASCSHLSLRIWYHHYLINVIIPCIPRGRREKKQEKSAKRVSKKCVGTSCKDINTCSKPKNTMTLVGCVPPPVPSTRLSLSQMQQTLLVFN